MRTPFLRKSPGPRLFPLLLALCLCLHLAGCGASRPDGGSLTPVRVGEDTAFYLDVSGSGINAEDLKYTVMGYLQSDTGMSMADSPGPDTLMVRVEVREIFPAGSSSMDARETLGTTTTGVLLGTLVGGLAGGRSGALIGAGVGAGHGHRRLGPGQPDQDPLGHAGQVGLAHGKKPDKLEEVVVSTDGVRLARRGPAHVTGQAGPAHQRGGHHFRRCRQTVTLRPAPRRGSAATPSFPSRREAVDRLCPLRL